MSRRPWSALAPWLASFALFGAAALADDPKPEDKPAAGSKDAPEGKEGKNGKEEGKEETKPEAKPEKEPPPTVAAEKGPFSVWVEAAGALEPLGAVEVTCEPEAYGAELEVLEAVGQGPVQSGDVLVRFDPEKYEEQLAASEKDLEIARRALAQREEEAKRAEEVARQAMEKARTEKTRSDEALSHFLKVDRELRVREGEHRIQGTRDNIQDQEEELEQLKKMYEGDDLVEGTEEIVLRRSKRQLERSRTWLGFQERRHKTLLEIDLPRDQENLEQNARREALELERLEATQAIALEQARIELEKARFTLERQTKTFGKLQGDRARLVVTAPAAGWAVPGSFAKGKWGGIDETAKALTKGQTLKAKQPIFTIVTPGAVAVRAALNEAGLLQVAAGQPAEVTLGALPDRKLAARVAKVARVSVDGNFELSLDLVEKDERFMPGWSCKVRVHVAEKPAAVTVPQASVVTEGEKKTVHVWADGKAAPREVQVGATSGGRVEIVKGLDGGERVLKTPPKPQ